MNPRRLNFDLLTLVLFAALVLWGWLTIFAVTSANGAEMLDFDTIHGRQMIWIGISVVIGGIILSLDHRFIEAISYLAYGLGIAMLILTLFLGKEVNGAQSWLIIGGQQFQPSEFAKLATAMALAKYMSRLQFSMQSPLQMGIAAGMVVVPAIIVILQNDTGSALV
ncbi:MAG: FtsW/RodA/SpoVE family cell cycle protein, partial [Bacteroidota bacterium]